MTLRNLISVGALFTFCSLFSCTTTAQTTDAILGPFLSEEDITWKVNEFSIARWKTLVGGIEGGHVKQDDVQFGLWELAPNAIYHAHKHEVPEIYYIVAGSADWTVGNETRKVGPGMTIYTQPGSVHRMVNLTNQPVRAIWFWWAPGGDSEVFAKDYVFTEEVPLQPANARFDTQDSERLH